ncbi:hypothetical protein [Tenuibacillus multivorans]|uniref:Uncharacterized protein n=1 Tax=Tenuibacillus multivorans TaxID=237069 RepID=A0A1H0EKK8_9BACI|nr:hypothetical protein [Tenuibacillus multivorans]GEL77120.1 hypothetical protein TMU01_13550 [Tenuibacillus multivorans]SDN82901.1 hypothetical protein SAMN05216498_3190 [Tenuibacillus multivorans]
MSDEFKHLEKGRSELGEFYLELKEQYGDEVSITYMDPRNISMIVGYLVKQKQKGRIAWLDILKHLCFHVKLNAIFINGYYLENTDDFDKIVSETS